MNTRLPCLWITLAASLSVACVDDPPPSPPCEQDCQDATAMRALREMAKLAYNLTLQGKPVGPQEATIPCPLGGNARIFGDATSNPIQGATEVSLTYVFDGCRYLQLDETPNKNYDMRLTGSMTQLGTIAVQPSATTALVMASDSMSFSGTVYDLPIPFEAIECEVQLGQSGNNLAGLICGREAGLDL